VDTYQCTVYFTYRHSSKDKASCHTVSVPYHAKHAHIISVQIHLQDWVIWCDVKKQKGTVVYRGPN